MRHFCTYFDGNYLSAGLSLYRSLRSYGGDFRLHVLCLDDTVSKVLRELSLSRVKIHELSAIEKYDDELREVKDSRRVVEYYFTLTAAFPRYLLDTRNIERITYMGADLYFFSPLDQIMSEIEDGSVAVHTHRFPEERRELERYGQFNADFISFADDTTGRACLERYRQNCLDWCYDRVEDGKFANQRYLDDWPDKYDDVVVLDHAGVGLAWWNHRTHTVNWSDDGVRVDDRPLVFYHFSDLRPVTRRIWKPPVGLSPVETYEIYLPYIRERLAATNWVEEETGVVLSDGSNRFSSEGLFNTIQLTQIGRTALEGLRTFRQGIRGNLLVVGTT